MIGADVPASGRTFAWHIVSKHGSVCPSSSGGSGCRRGPISTCFTIALPKPSGPGTERGHSAPVISLPATPGAPARAGPHAPPPRHSHLLLTHRRQEAGRHHGGEPRATRRPAGAR